ncbi:MAG: recombinase family protein [Alphaproteobacteria bacterium GM202ARS2]|nr:recombinase family protein [Alphaproteobacteria bacterium GM202ARS2]
MLIGYARVSTAGQNLDRQRELLSKAECEKVFEEKLTGVDRKRPKLAAMIAEAKDGDTVIITSLDRLARSTHDLFEIIKKLEAKNVKFRSLQEPWADTSSTMGRFLTTVFAGLSELERRIINERTEEGRISARKRGVKFGRKPTLTLHQRSEVTRMLEEGTPIRAIAQHFNVGVATIDRIKKTSQPA